MLVERADKYDITFICLVYSHRICAPVLLEVCEAGYFFLQRLVMHIFSNGLPQARVNRSLMTRLVHPPSSVTYDSTCTDSSA